MEWWQPLHYEIEKCWKKMPDSYSLQYCKGFRTVYHGFFHFSTGRGYVTIAVETTMQHYSRLKRGDCKCPAKGNRPSWTIRLTIIVFIAWSWVILLALIFWHFAENVTVDAKDKKSLYFYCYSIIFAITSCCVLPYFGRHVHAVSFTSAVSSIVLFLFRLSSSVLKFCIIVS